MFPGWQTLFAQQPFGQLAALQTHAPLTQVVPLGQATQATPFVPQCWLLLVWHVLFWQQPLAQFAGPQRLTQEPFWHCVPLGHATQAPPPVPQAALVFPGLQVVPSQQPLEQLVALQTH